MSDAILVLLLIVALVLILSWRTYCATKLIEQEWSRKIFYETVPWGIQATCRELGLTVSGDAIESVRKEMLREISDTLYLRDEMKRWHD